MDAAEQLGVTQAKVSTMLSGESSITAWMLYYLASVMRINPLWILMNMGEKRIREPGEKRWTLEDLEEVATALPDEMVFRIAAERAAKR